MARLLIELSHPFVYSDRHAYLASAQFFNDLISLNQIDWDILQNHDFRYDQNDPAKMERYQAEALVYQKVPVEALLGVVCYNEEVESSLKETLAAQSVELQIVVRPRYYF